MIRDWKNSDFVKINLLNGETVPNKVILYILINLSQILATIVNGKSTKSKK